MTFDARKSHQRPRLRGRWAAVLVLAVTLAAACSSKGSSPSSSSGPGAPYSSRSAITAPTVKGAGSLGPATDAERPKMLPVAAGPALAGRALPTNTWWTSALVGDYTSALWAFPVVARGGPNGLELSAPEPVASSNSVTASAAPALTVGGAVQRVTVTGYGDFSVDLSLQRQGGALKTGIAQGSPFIPVAAPAGTLPIALAAATEVDDALGHPLAVGDSFHGNELRVTSLGQTWFLASANNVTWKRTPAGIEATSPAAQTFVFSPLPTGAGPNWGGYVTAAARQPVTDTRSTLTRQASTVHQTLQWEGAAAAGVIAVLPHQRATLGADAKAVTGHYDTTRGQLTLVLGNQLQLSIPLPGFLPGAPSIPLTADEKGTLYSDLVSDLETTDTSDAGSYYGPKALGRLATMLDLARRIDDQPAVTAIMKRLEPVLIDWLTYSGPGDKHWLAYDSEWGGIVAHPSEFDNADYNDHHFQYGYLIAAAAIVSASDPTFVTRYGAVVDLLVTDVIGADNGPKDSDSAAFPPFRVFSAYEGHSVASGFTTVADGDDQESSSEAVHAWAAIAEWGMATNQPKVTDAGLTRYALEAESARTYWLGENGRLWPDGYPHDTVGIVWGGKVDFATFFDAKPEAVIGIQLLPFTFDSLYRTSPTAAAQRDAAAAAAGGGTPSLWPDLFLMDSALTDPAAALARLTPDLSIEPGNSRAFTEYWLLALDKLGTPRTDIAADSPYGYAFGSDASLHLAAVNPTTKPISVTWRNTSGKVVGTAKVAPHAAITLTP